MSFAKMYVVLKGVLGVPRDSKPSFWYGLEGGVLFVGPHLYVPAWCWTPHDMHLQQNTWPDIIQQFSSHTAQLF